MAFSRRWARLEHLLVAVATGAVLAGCGAVAVSPSPLPTAAPTPAGTSPRGTGGTADDAVACTLLGPADFAAAGFDGARPPRDTPDAFGGHYCVYAAPSDTIRGILLDVFPHPGVPEAKTTFETVAASLPGGTRPVGATYDEVSFAIEDEVATLAVRQGRLVFVLSVPNDMNVAQGLVQLADLVLERAGDAAG